MNPLFLLAPVVLLVLLVVLGEWWLTRRRPRRVPLMFANLWIGVFEQTMGLLVYVGLVGIYDQLTGWSPFLWSSRSIGAWVLTVLAVDLAFFGYHFFSHRTALGWSLHAVHHQSPELNAPAAVRNSPLGGAIQFLFHVPLALAGLPTVCWVGAKGLNTLWQLVLHTEARWQLPWAEGWVNSPAAHRLHHGVQPIYQDRNLGGLLLVWDRLAGTYVTETVPPRYGTVPALAHLDPVLAQVQPLTTLFRAVKADGWAVLLRAPRAGVNGRGLPPVLDTGVRRSVALIQLLGALVLLLGMAQQQVPLWVGVPSLVAAGSLAALVAQGRSWALPADIGRVVLTLLLLEVG